MPRPRKKTSQNPFIVIEALDAGGSQTQTDLLARYLKQAKYDLLKLHFPQEDRATGRLVYDTFLHTNNALRLSRREQALLYIMDFFSRADDISRHLTRSGRRAVISDRFCTSTFAYQTIGTTGSRRGKMMQWLLQLTYQAKPPLPKPDVVIFLDTPVAVSLQRLVGKKQDYFENKDKLNAIRKSYLTVAREQRWLIINSIDQAGNERSRQDLHREILTLLAPTLE